MIPVTVIGMGMSPSDLTAIHHKLITEADVLVAGRRHLDFFADHPAQKIEITKHIQEMIGFVKTACQTQRVVLLASGDPLFFGIGSTLIKQIGAQNVIIHPNITSVAAAFAKIKMAWHDAAIISLHGDQQNDPHFLARIVDKPKLAILTDPKNNPGKIARILKASGNTAYKICVLEHLGLATEKIGWYSFEELLDITFADPNLVILIKNDWVKDDQVKDINPDIHVGMPDTCFAHQNGLITKPEIRAVTLSKLKLHDHHIFWDLGAGSGSVSIEAAFFIKKGKIIAVEKNPDRINDIKTNQNRYHVSNMQIVQATLPDAMETLDDPDRVFIGGSGKQLETVIKRVDQRLRPGGRIVVNTVLLTNLHTTTRLFEQLDYQTDLVQLQVSWGTPMPYDQMLKAQNPVWIISGEKKSKGHKNEYDKISH